ncbi:MAG: hypothetical protein EXR01_05115 [Acetobacteraceae bacterium]|nr:hypothetical protein [Acetobacteraceae bacterium]
MSGTNDDTLPRLLARNARSMPERVAMREKRSGIWQAESWAAHCAATIAFARGLAALGFQRGDRLAVLGDNRRALYRAQLAAMALGGAVVPCWPDVDTEWLAHVLADSGVSIVVAEDQDQVEKLLNIKDRLPMLREIVFTDPRGVHHDNLAFIHSVTATVAAGEKGGVDVAATIAAGRPDDVCLIFYLTPDTGPARAAVLTHAQMIEAAIVLSKAEDTRPTDEYFSYLPMAWVAEALYGTVLSLLVGFACSCPEDPETARRDLRELGPTILLAPPRIWNSLLGEIESKAAHSTPLKRRICTAFLPEAYGAGAPASTSFLGNFLVAAPLRDQLGLGRVRWAHSGGLALRPHVQDFFEALGVHLRRGVVLSDHAGLSALATDIGAPLRLADGSEIDAVQVESVLCRNPYIADAVVIGDGTVNLAALIALDTTAVGDWAQARSLTFTSAAELTALPEIRTLLGEVIAQANACLPANQRITRYRLLQTAPTSVNAEASLSRILQRRLAQENQAAQARDLFADPPPDEVNTLPNVTATIREQVA